MRGCLDLYRDSLFLFVVPINTISELCRRHTGLSFKSVEKYGR